MGKQKFIIILFFLVTFLAGLGAGIWVSHKFIKNSRHHGKKDWHIRLLEKFKRELELTPQQADKIKAILSDHRIKYKTLKDKFRPEFDKRKTETRAAIRSVLNTSQRKKYKEMVRRYEEKVKSRNNSCN